MSKHTTYIGIKARLCSTCCIHQMLCWQDTYELRGVQVDLHVMDE